MKTWVKVLLITLATIYVVSTVIVVVKIYRLVKTAKKTRQAYGKTWMNSNKCGSNNCYALVTDLPIPTQDGTSYNTDVARYCADLVVRVENPAHKDGEGGPILIPKGLTKITDLYNDSKSPIFGVVLTDGHVAWISFRGTQSAQEWIQDMHYGQSSLIPSTKKNQDHSQKVLKLRGVETPPSIHNGFLEAYNSCADDINKALQQIKPTQIIITGHSLGASVSCIAALAIVNNGYTNVIVYNFACPMTGDPVFCNLISQKNIPIYRHTNACDIVPTLPSSVSANYDSPNSPYIYTQCGVTVPFSDNWLSMENNHLMGVYVNAFNKGLYTSFKQVK